MRYWTLGEIKEKIEDEFDLAEEPDILSDGELVGYINDAIDTCEQHFIRLGDYFLSTETIPLIGGVRDYELPSEIYATKIRKLIHNYREVKPLRDIAKVTIAETYTGNDFSYLLINNPGATPKIRLYPTPSASGSLDIYYTRNANRIDETGSNDQTVDVPEAMLYIFEYLRMCIYKKEKDLNSVQLCKDNLIKYEEMLLSALAARVDDENNTIEPDIGIYEDML